MSRRWALLVALAALVPAAAGCGFEISRMDPAPPEFLVVGRRGPGGEVVVRAGACRAGEVRSLILSAVVEPPDGGRRPILWHVQAPPGAGPHLDELGSLELTVGRPVEGMDEIVPMDGPLPTGERLMLEVGYSRGGLGYDFIADDLRPDVSTDGRGAEVPPEDFDAALSGTC